MTVGILRLRRFSRVAKIGFAQDDKVEVRLLYSHRRTGAGFGRCTMSGGPKNF
jgi:hypothetical protein